jgi:hypothetical protein
MWFQIMWIIIYLLNLIAISVICLTICQYLEHKPLGLQTLLDLLVTDLLKIVILSNSVITSVIVISRFHILFPTICLPPNIAWIKFCTLSYYFFYLMMVLNHTITCIVRVISVLFVGYMVQTQ